MDCLFDFALKSIEISVSLKSIILFPQIWDLKEDNDTPSKGDSLAFVIVGTQASNAQGTIRL
jgi:hypothetical protein